MQKVIALLPQYQDYRAFCKTPDKHNSTICYISSAFLWVNQKQDKFRFQITSNRFLRGMIRILVDNILAVGKGKMTVNAFKEHLKKGTRPKFLNFAKPQGLYLSKVTYPFLELPSKTIFPNLLFDNHHGIGERPL